MPSVIMKTQYTEVAMLLIIRNVLSTNISSIE